MAAGRGSGCDQRHHALDGLVEGGLGPRRPAAGHLGRRPGRCHGAAVRLSDRSTWGAAGRRPPPPGCSVSLPEACRLSDALVAQLRVRLGLDPSGAEITERIRQLRAQMERIRDQVDLEPAGTAQQQAAETQSKLARRLKEIADKAGRGGDVGRAARTAGDRGRHLRAGPDRQRRAAVATRRDLLRGPGTSGRSSRPARWRCRASPNGASPGSTRRRATPYPTSTPSASCPTPPSSWSRTSRRLDQVSRAMTLAQTAYTTALSEHEELDSRLEAYRAKARRPASPGVADADARPTSWPGTRWMRGPTRMALRRPAGLALPDLSADHPPTTGALMSRARQPARLHRDHRRRLLRHLRQPGRPGPAAPRPGRPGPAPSTGTAHQSGARHGAPAGGAERDALRDVSTPGPGPAG